MLKASDADFEAVVEAAPGPVLVDLWAPWCGPCRDLAPVLRKVARRLADRLTVVKVNADECPKTNRRFRVRAVPLLVLLKDGRRFRREGSCSAEELEAWVLSKLDAPRARTGRSGRAPDASRLSAKAVALAEKGLLARAAAMWEQAVGLAPDRPDIRCNLASTYAQLGDDERSHAQARAAARLVAKGWKSLEADDSHLLAVIGTVLPETDAKLAGMLLRKAVGLDDSDPLAWFNLGAGLEREGDEEGAARAYQTAARLAPDEPDAPRALGAVYFQRGLLDEATVVLEECVRRWPGDASSQFNLGLCYLDSGRHDEARRVFLDHVAAEPDDAIGHGMLGVAYSALGWKDEARQAQAEARRIGGGTEAVDTLLTEIDERIDDGDDNRGRGIARLLLMAALLARRGTRRR